MTERIPLVLGAISWAGSSIDDNIVAIGGIVLILLAAIICQPFDQESNFALTMSGISGIAALAGYEIGKRNGPGNLTQKG